MLNEPTIEKLKVLRLDALAAAWAEQQKMPEIGQLSFDERLGLLVDAEHLARENKRLGRLLKEAKLRLGQACVEDLTTRPGASSTRPSSANSRPVAGCTSTRT